MDRESEVNMNERSVMVTENHDINSVEGYTQAASRLETNECISSGGYSICQLTSTNLIGYLDGRPTLTIYERSRGHEVNVCAWHQTRRLNYGTRTRHVQLSFAYTFQRNAPRSMLVSGKNNSQRKEKIPLAGVLLAIMATQDDSGIPLEISNQQQNLRLLELPPSLLTLLVSKDPPKYVPALIIYVFQCEPFADTSESLWLKSAEYPSADVDFKLSRPNAVLCTDDSTYQLRQVQSSNSILILQPSENCSSDNEIFSPGLSAIAQCTATLELIPSDTAASVALISRLLRQSLPLYTGIDTDVELGTNATFSSRSKAP